MATCTERVSFVPPSVPRLTETNATRPTHARKCKALVVANVKIAKCEETTRLHLTRLHHLACVLMCLFYWGGVDMRNESYRLATQKGRTSFAGVESASWPGANFCSRVPGEHSKKQTERFMLTTITDEQAKLDLWPTGQ